MRRRSLLLSAGIVAAGAATGVGYWRWQDFPSRALYPGRDLGHRLRDLKPSQWPAPAADYATDVLIAGSGIAGLTAAWRLAREGHTRFALVAGPEPHGNAASGTAGVGGERLRYPTGAHYLPLPTRESIHVRTMLADFGILQGDPNDSAPTYDERVLVHAPEERLYRDGQWHDGLVPEATPDIARFVAFVDGLRDARGADGRKVFAIPTALSSSDPRWTALDALTFAAWLDRERYIDPALRWYLDYCCRDDYGADTGHVSAWAGLHYFASRDGQARNGERGAVLTWPEGLDALATRLDDAAFAVRADGSRPLRLDGVVLSLVDTRDGVEALCANVRGGSVSTYRVRARRAICAMPLFVARHVVAPLRADGFDPMRDQPPIAPWLVANAVMNRHPEEAPGAGLAWDNVLFGSAGLGYVVSTHQEIRVAPSVPTVFTAYRALADRTPDDARRWLEQASASELGGFASEELRAVYGYRFAPCVERFDITVRGHAMASPAPGFRNRTGLAALRAADGRILYAHADLSGMSLFEEAAWWGWQAAGRLLGERPGANIA